MKKIWKLFRSIFLTATSLFILLTIFVYFQKNRIIQYAIQQLNPYLQGKLYIRQIDFTFLRTFPNITLEIHQMRFVSNHPLFQNDTLLQFQYLAAYFNVIDVLVKHNYVLKKLKAHTGKIAILEKKGIWSPSTIFQQDTTPSQSPPFSIFLKEITLNRFQIHFNTDEKKSNFQVLLDTLYLTGKMTQNEFQTEIYTQGHDLTVLVNQNHFSPIKRFRLKGKIARYSEFYKIENLNYQGDGLFLNGSGRISSHFISISFQSATSSLSQYLTYLRQFFTLPALVSQADGNIEIQARIEGPISDTQLPELNVKGKVSNGNFSYQGNQLKNIKFLALLTFPLSEPEKFQLSIQNFQCQWKDQTFQANMELYNLFNPQLLLNLHGKLFVPLLQPFLPDSHLILKNGILTLNMETKKAKAITSLSDFHLTGIMTIDNFIATYNSIPLQIPKSQFLFLHHTILIKHLDLLLPHHSFHCKGRLLHYPSLFAIYRTPQNSFLTQTLPQLEIIIKTPSLYIDTLQQLFTQFRLSQKPISQLREKDSLRQIIPKPDSVSKPDSTGVPFSIPFKIHFTCQVNHLNWNCTKTDFAYFRGSYQKDTFTIDTCFFHAWNGEIGLKGTFIPPNVFLYTTIKDIDTRAFFDCFQELGKQLGIGPHIYGNISLQSHLYFQIIGDSIDYSTLEGYGVASATNLELHQYAPLYQFNQFIRFKDLQTARFENMHTSFWIKDGWFHFAKMRVKVNRYELYIEGRQHYQGLLDYSVQLILPFFSKKKIKTNPEIEAYITEDQEINKPSLFIRVTGTLDDPQFKLDKSALRSKWQHDLWKERTEIKSHLRQFIQEELKTKDTSTVESLIEEE